MNIAIIITWAVVLSAQACCAQSGLSDVVERELKRLSLPRVVTIFSKESSWRLVIRSDGSAELGRGAVGTAIIASGTFKVDQVLRELESLPVAHSPAEPVTVNVTKPGLDVRTTVHSPKEPVIRRLFNAAEDQVERSGRRDFQNLFRKHPIFPDQPRTRASKAAPAGEDDLGRRVRWLDSQEASRVPLTRIFPKAKRISEASAKPLKITSREEAVRHLDENVSVREFPTVAFEDAEFFYFSREAAEAAAFARGMAVEKATGEIIAW